MGQDLLDDEPSRALALGWSQLLARTQLGAQTAAIDARIGEPVDMVDSQTVDHSLGI